MIIIPIIVGLLVAALLYRVLFYDLSDFADGGIRFSTLFLVKRHQWPFTPWRKLPAPEDFEDESWSSGIRFFCFLAASVGSGYLAYDLVQKHPG